MTASLRALLAGAIDYAGLFPPAELPLGQAFLNYLSYRQCHDAWMLGCFVVPAARLVELSRFDDLMRRESDPRRFTICDHSGNILGHFVPAVSMALKFSILGRGGNTLQVVLNNLDADLQDLRLLLGKCPNRIEVETLEWKLSRELTVPMRNLDTLLQRLRNSVIDMEETGPESHYIFFELPFLGESGQQDFTEVLLRLQTIDLGGVQQTGCKLRCGGQDAPAFPTATQIAFVIDQCCKAKIPLKLTAGLHHPLPRFDSSLGVTVHGFINIFIAAAIAFRWGPSVDVLVQVLNETNPHAFSFSDEKLCWKDWRVEVGAVHDARLKLLTSFGSCSFDEPRKDLRELGWL